MQVQIPDRVWRTSGQSRGNINGTLDWILGYINPANPKINIIEILQIKTVLNVQSSNVTVEINEEIAKEITIRFKSCDGKIISVLLIIAYILGGQE